MKYADGELSWTADRSHPARGAWIEIVWLFTMPPDNASHPARGAWIEIFVPER